MNDNIEAIERRLWSSADQLRSNSNLASNEYFLPVMGLIFLRHAYSRYLAVKPEIESGLPTRHGKTRPLTTEDFSSKNTIFLRPRAQFDYLVGLPDKADRAQAIINAMESIEKDYKGLRDILPKNEYNEVGSDVIGNILRIFNDPALKSISGDVFGRIYEYFLTQFANQSAHDGGEFFTPVSLVQMIVNTIEPSHGTVFDPACGSCGMFVQSAHFIKNQHEDPNRKVTFFGQEKNATSIRLAKMNLAVHGLEGKIAKGITYYEDQHKLLGAANFVMANPPFNVDDVDAEKIKKDPRLPFGLPGVNKKKAVSNGNYLWISYFYSYLNDSGRAGFVMSSQASSAGGTEAGVRRKLVETGHVDAMVSVRSNFFYTRTVPCELWFFNKNKPKQMKNKVLMLDARNVYRQVTRKIYDFSPEQLANLASIVWLYRGETKKYLSLVSDYYRRMLAEGAECFNAKNKEGEPVHLLPDFIAALSSLTDSLEPILKTLPDDAAEREPWKELLATIPTFHADAATFKKTIANQQTTHKKQQTTNGALKKAVDRLAPLAETSRDLIKQADLLYKFASRLSETCEKSTRTNGARNGKEIVRARKATDEARRRVVEQLKQVHYFWQQAHWLTERFPNAKLRDVAGLVKLVDRKEIEANDWSLTPGRYVGVAPEEEDENFDFEETMRNIHVELEGLNAEAVELAATIKKNFEGLGI